MKVDDNRRNALEALMKDHKLTWIVEVSLSDGFVSLRAGDKSLTNGNANEFIFTQDIGRILVQMLAQATSKTLFGDGTIEKGVYRQEYHFPQP